jgi:hypothetical protein
MCKKEQGEARRKVEGVETAKSEEIHQTGWCGVVMQRCLSSDVRQRDPRRGIGVGLRQHELQLSAPPNVPVVVTVLFEDDVRKNLEHGGCDPEDEGDLRRLCVFIWSREHLQNGLRLSNCSQTFFHTSDGLSKERRGIEITQKYDRHDMITDEKPPRNCIGKYASMIIVAGGLGKRKLRY